MRLALHLTATLFFVAAQLVAQSTPLWRYTATAPISFVRVTPVGSVVVATADGLVGLDAESGLVQWKRDDLKSLETHKPVGRDRKSTRPNSSHRTTSDAVFCLQKNTKL